MNNIIYIQEAKEKTKTAVILCVYRRLEYFRHTAKSLSSQTNQNFDLYISNNGIDNKIIRYVEKYLSKENINVQIENHHNDFKPFSRFLIAQDLANAGYEKIIFIDDDEIIPSTFIQECYDQYEDKSFKSFYAHKISDNYWGKEKLLRNELGNYAGTGGLVCNAKFFLDNDFYSCPEEFYIIDDLWLSYYILKYTDYKIKLLETDIEFIKDLKATAIGLTDVKQNFYKDYIAGLIVIE